MIKEDLKKIQIVCRNQEQVKNCLNYLKQLGFDVEDEDFGKEYNGWNIVYWEKYQFIFSAVLDKNLKIEFYNKKLVKILQKFIKKKEEKEKNRNFLISKLQVMAEL